MFNLFREIKPAFACGVSKGKPYRPARHQATPLKKPKNSRLIGATYRGRNRYAPPHVTLADIARRNRIKETRQQTAIPEAPTAGDIGQNARLQRQAKRQRRPLKVSLPLGAVDAHRRTGMRL